MTPPNIPFTPDPEQEYRDLCEQQTSLRLYIEREGAELRASGQHDALSELERLEGAMLDRLSELHAQGAHLRGRAGGTE